MLYLKNNFVSIFFLIAFILSCSRTSSSSKTSTTPVTNPPTENAAIQLKSELRNGITRYGVGSQEEPFDILINESISLSGFPLALSDLFENLVSVSEDADKVSEKVGDAQLDTTNLTVVPRLGSILPITLSGSRANDTIYAKLYFQDAARLTTGVYIGEAVLDKEKRGQIAKEDSEAAVTLYKAKSDATSWSVDLLSLFSYNKEKLNPRVYKKNDAEDAAEEFSEIIGSSENLEKSEDAITYTIQKEGETAAPEIVQLLFEPKQGENTFLYPSRKQTLKLVPNDTVASSLVFSDLWEAEGSKWTTESRERGDRGEAPESARILKVVWSEPLNLFDYLKKSDEETVTVSLYAKENVAITSLSSNGTVLNAGDVLDKAVFAIEGGYKFGISGELASATFKIVRANDTLSARELYIKVELAKKPSALALKTTLPGNHNFEGTGVDFNNPLVIDGTYAANTELNLKDFVDESTASTTENLSYKTVASAEDQEGSSITGTSFSSTASGAVVIKVVDTGSFAVEAKTIFLQFRFAANASTLQVNTGNSAITTQDKTGAVASPYTLSVAKDAFLALGSLTINKSPNGTLSYTVAGVKVSTNVTSLKVGESLATDTVLTPGEKIVIVTDSGDNTIAGRSLYFKVSFVKNSAMLKAALGKANANGVYIHSVTKDQTLALGELTDAATVKSPLSYSIEGSSISNATSATVLEVGSGDDSANKIFVEPGDLTITVNDAGDTSYEGETLSFKLTFAKKSGALAAAVGKADTDGVYTYSVVKDTMLILSTLTDADTVKGDLNYTIEDVANTISVTENTQIKVGIGKDSSETIFVKPGELTITVSDTGGIYYEEEALSFRVTFKRNSGVLAAALGEANANGVYIHSVSKDIALTLKDLTKNVQGDLTYTVVNDDTSVNVNVNADTVLKVGSSTNTESEIFVKSDKKITITVSDAGGIYYEAKKLSFQVTFAKSSGTLKAANGVGETDEDGTPNNAYTYSVGKDRVLILNALTDPDTVQGRLGYGIEGSSISNATSATVLEVGSGDDSTNKIFVKPNIALTITVGDTGNDNYTRKILHFKVTFAKKSATLAASLGTLDNSVTNSKTYTYSVAEDETLTLKALTKDVQGSVNYTILEDDSVVSTVVNAETVLKVGQGENTKDEVFVTPGELTITVSDDGGGSYEREELYFKVTFVKNSGVLAAADTVGEADGDGVYTYSVDEDTKLTLSTLIDAATVKDTLSYSIKKGSEDITKDNTTVSVLEVGDNSGNDDASKIFVAPGEYTITVSDSGGTYYKKKELSFKVTFAKKSATLAVADAIGEAGVDGTYTYSVTQGQTLTLSDLTNTSTVQGTLSYSITQGSENITKDNTAVTMLEIGDNSGNNDTSKIFVQPDTYTITVRDSGGALYASKTLSFKVTFAEKSATLAAALGAYENGVYTYSVAKDATLTLSALTKDDTVQGTLSYSIEGFDITNATSTTVLEVGDNSGNEDASKIFVKPGTYTITVTDKGGTYYEEETLSFKVTFLEKSATLEAAVGEDDQDGTSSNAYTHSVITDQKLTLSTLTKDNTVQGTLSYSIEGFDITNATSTTVLEVGDNSGNDDASKIFVEPGTYTITVTDKGGTYYEQKALSFKVTFAKKSATLAAALGEVDADGIYTYSVPKDVPLTLSTLTKDVQGTLSYTPVNSLDNTKFDTKVTTLEVGSGNNTTSKIFVAPGDYTITVTDNGGIYYEQKALSFKVTFKSNSGSLEAADSVTTIGKAGTENDPYTLNVSSTDSLALKNLTKNNQTALVYSSKDEDSLSSATGETLLRVGDANDTTSVIVVPTGTSLIIMILDDSNTYYDAKIIYIKVTFVAQSATLEAAVGEDGQDGTSSNAYTYSVKKDDKLTLGTLINATTVKGDLSYNIEGSSINNATSTTVLEVGSGDDTTSNIFVKPGELSITVTDNGGAHYASKTLSFKVTFTEKPATLAAAVGEDGQDGTSSNAYTHSVTTDQTLTLSALTDDVKGTLSYSITQGSGEITKDNTTVTMLKVGDNSDNNDTSKIFVAPGTYTITVTDTGGTYYEEETLSFKVTFAGKSATLAAVFGEADADGIYTYLVEKDVPLTLSTLTTAVQGTLSYSITQGSKEITNDNTAVTVLEVGDNSDNNDASKIFVAPGTYTITVTDNGGTYYEQKALSFKVTFKKKSARLAAADGVGETNEDSVYTYSVAKDAMLTLSALTNVATVKGSLSYSIEDSTITNATSTTVLEVGSDNDSASKIFVEPDKELTITVTDNGGTYYEQKVLSFKVIFDTMLPQLSFEFPDSTHLVIKASELLASTTEQMKNGLTFSGTEPTPMVTEPTYDADSDAYQVTLSPALSAGAVLNLAADSVRDVAGNGNEQIEQSVFPTLKNVTASSATIANDPNNTTLTFSFAQKIDASSFTTADLEIVDSTGTVVTDALLSLSNVSPNSGASQAVDVTLTAGLGFAGKVQVRMKSDNQISLPSSSLVATVTGGSPLITVDRKAPVPTVSFNNVKIATNPSIEFTVTFDEKVNGDLQVANFTTANGVSVSNITGKDEKTFTATLTVPSVAKSYSLSLNANVVVDESGNKNSASAATSVAVPSFSAAPLPRHGGNTTLTITFLEQVTGFTSEDLTLTDAVGNTDTVMVSGFNAGTDGKYTITLTTKGVAASGAFTVSVVTPYQGVNSPSLSYAIPLSVPVLSIFSATDGTHTVTSNADTQKLLLTETTVHVSAATVAGDTLELFRNGTLVATEEVETPGLQTLQIGDGQQTKANNSRFSYTAILKDSGGERVANSNLFYVSFEKADVAIPPAIIGPVANIDFSDDFSTSSSSWKWKHKANHLVNISEVGISEGKLILTQTKKYFNATMVLQEDLILSPQAALTFEATFIFGNDKPSGDGIAFFTYDARDQPLYSNSKGSRFDKYPQDGNLMVSNGGLRSLFFAVAARDYIDGAYYAGPAKASKKAGTGAVNLSDLLTPTGGNSNSLDKQQTVIWDDKSYRVRVTMANNKVVMERADISANGAIGSWNVLFEKTFAEDSHIPDNIKIGFSSTTGQHTNDHSVDDLSVKAELFVPYTLGGDAVQAAPKGVVLTAGRKTDNSVLAISGIRVRIDSGYKDGDSLTFSEEKKDGDTFPRDKFTSTLNGNTNTLTVEAVAGQSPTVEEFLEAFKAINFSTNVAGDRVLSWQVFAKNGDNKEISSGSYISQIRAQ